MGHLRSSTEKQSVHDSLGCELVGVPTLVINWPRTGESRSSRDFTNELITFREFISLNLALTAASGIDFPCSSFCI